jgi:ketosteroid isomerase-like protein
MTDWSRDTERAMLQENVEIVRQLLAHWKRNDWRGGRELVDDDCEVVFSTSWFPDAGAYRVGREALRAWTNFNEAWKEIEVSVERVVDVGEHVIALVRLRGRGLASGVSVDAQVGAIFAVRDTKIVRYELTDRQDALEAAGLSE